MSGRSVYAQPPGPVATSVPYVERAAQVDRELRGAGPELRPRYHTAGNRTLGGDRGLVASLLDLNSTTRAAVGPFGDTALGPAAPASAAPAAEEGCADCG